LQHGGAAVGGTDGITHKRITCYTCQSRGHYSDACPDAVIEPDPAPVVPAVQLLQVEIEDAIEVDDVSAFTFAQQDDKYSIIPSSWVLLDSQSTVSVFRNAKYLKTKSAHEQRYTDLILDRRYVVWGSMVQPQLVGEHPVHGCSKETMQDYHGYECGSSHIRTQERWHDDEV